MRINAEKARITKFKSIVKISAAHYYKILDCYKENMKVFKEQQQAKIDQ
jgi:hypothetical protein